MPKSNIETAALVVRRTVPFPQDVVFKAFSDPAVMRKWFFTGPDWTNEVANDFRVGGDFTITMKLDKERSVPHVGVYKEIVPGEKLVFTWNSPYAMDSVVTVVLRKSSGGTEIILTHEFLADDMRSAHAEGWAGCLDNLVLALGSKP